MHANQLVYEEEFQGQLEQLINPKDYTYEEDTAKEKEEVDA
jgi:hypothetical protein